MNLKKSPLGNLWYGFKVFTVFIAAILFWLSIIGAAFDFFSHPFVSLGLSVIALIFYGFSRSIEKSLLEEDKRDKDDDDEIGPYYQVKFN